MIEGFVAGLIGAVLGALSVYVVNWAVAGLASGTRWTTSTPTFYPLWWQGGTWPLGSCRTLALLGGVLGAVAACRPASYLRT
jgi:hypothetical protein